MVLLYGWCYEKKNTSCFNGVFIVFGLTGCGSVLKKENFKIRDAETKSLKFADFDNGFIKLKGPEGWKVDVLGDYIVNAYNPAIMVEKDINQ